MAKARTNSKAGSRGNSRVEPGSGDGFWDRPALINLLADLLLLAGGALLAWAVSIMLQRLPMFPLKQLVVVTSLDKVSQAQIEHAARRALSGNFFTVNLEAAQAAFERMPWVRSASLRRVWPDGIELNLEEHRAVARWTPLDGEARLVNTHGDVFTASTPEPLPLFAGPEGSASRVLARYREFTDGLSSIRRVPVVVHLSAREAWNLKLDDGVILELGRDQPKHPLVDRLSRFTTHYAAVTVGVKSRLQTIGVVDMRYPNGFALRGIAALSPEGKLRPPPPDPRSALHSRPASAARSSASLNPAYAPRPGAGVTDHLPRLAGEVGRGCGQCQAHAADALAEVA